MPRQLAREMLQAAAVGFELRHHVEHLLRVVVRPARWVTRPKRLERKHAEQRADFGRIQLVAAAGDGLIERRQRIAHAALAGARQHRNGIGIGGDAFLLHDPFHALDQLREIDGPETELLAARDDRRRNLVRFGGAQEEHHPLGRLLQRLEQGVEGFAGDLMGFVDDENFVAVARRAEADALAQLAHFVDAAVGRRVDLDHVHRGAAGDLQATGALAAGRGRRSLLAIQAARENARDGGLAGAALARKKCSRARCAAG